MEDKMWTNIKECYDNPEDCLIDLILNNIIYLSVLIFKGIVNLIVWIFDGIVFLIGWIFDGIAYLLGSIFHAVGRFVVYLIGLVSEDIEPTHIIGFLVVFIFLFVLLAVLGSFIDIENEKEEANKKEKNGG